MLLSILYYFSFKTSTTITNNFPATDSILSVGPCAPRNLRLRGWERGRSAGSCHLTSALHLPTLSFMTCFLPWSISHWNLAELYVGLQFFYACHQQTPTPSSSFLSTLQNLASPSASPANAIGQASPANAIGQASPANAIGHAELFSITRFRFSICLVLFLFLWLLSSFFFYNDCYYFFHDCYIDCLI